MPIKAIDELVYFPTWAAGRHGYADRIRQLFQEYHQSKGMRMTQQRNLILDYLLKANSVDGKPRFEVKYERPHHDHLICIQCGAIHEIQWPQVERIQEKTCKKIGFSPLFHRHEIFGRCRLCCDKKLLG